MSKLEVIMVMASDNNIEVAFNDHCNIDQEPFIQEQVASLPI